MKIKLGNADWSNLKLCRVQEPEDPWHGQLSHRQEEGAEQWDGHH
jgi:hypothetical protein